MVERLLSMREVPGSMPGSSNSFELDGNIFSRLLFKDCGGTVFPLRKKSLIYLTFIKCLTKSNTIFKSLMFYFLNSSPNKKGNNLYFKPTQFR